MPENWSRSSISDSWTVKYIGSQELSTLRITSKPHHARPHHSRLHRPGPRRPPSQPTALRPRNKKVLPIRRLLDEPKPRSSSPPLPAPTKLTPPGSFGASPAPISAVYHHYQHQSELRPDPFIRYTYPRLLQSSRRALATFINAPVSSIVYLPNATTGINTVLRGLRYTPTDKLLYFDFIYGACGNTVKYVCETTPATAIRIQVHLPISDDELLRVFRRAVTEAGETVRLAVFDAIVSVPGIRLPFERLIAACREMGVLSLVDAAHGVGHVPLDITALDPDFLTSNCHKWLFAPRGCAFLYVAARNHGLLRSTLPTSWGFVPEGEEALVEEGEDAWGGQFTYMGTTDGSSYLCVPAAMAFREWLGGEEKIMEYVYEIAGRGAEIFRARFGTEVMASGGEGGVGMFNVRLPIEMGEVEEGARGRVVGYLTGEMGARGTFVSVFEYKGAWWCRISGQIYLEESDFVKGASVVEELVEGVRSGAWLA